MTDRQVFRWATTSARLLAGTLASAGAVALVVTAISLPWPRVEREPARVEVLPAAAATSLVCTGDLVVAGRDLARPARLTSAAGQAVTSGVVTGSPQPTAEPLAVTDSDLAGPQAITAPPTDSARTDLAASGSASVFADDLAGFAASACRPPLVESWLVGGSGATGAADLVLLSNPGSVVATVQLTVFGASGPQNPAGGTDVIVPARSQRIVALAGIALGEESPVIRVTASGAPVQASLQTSLTRVLDPVGVDQVGPIATPETMLVIAGVEVTQAPGAEGASESASVVRVLSPGADASATITVRAVGSRDTALPPVTVPLAAGIPTEVDLGALPIGRYVIDVDSEAPVVAGAWQSAGTGRGADFAWYTPSPTIATPSLFAVPRGAPATLVLANPTDEAVEVVLSTAAGDPVDRIQVPPGASVERSLRTTETYLLDSAGATIRAAVSLTGDSALAGFPVWPADAAVQPVVVYP